MALKNMKKQKLHVATLHKMNKNTKQYNRVLQHFEPDAFASIKKPNIFGRIAKFFGI